MARDNKKRLSVDLPVVIHDALSKVAKRYNTPITDIVTQLVLNFVLDDEIREKE